MMLPITLLIGLVLGLLIILKVVRVESARRQDGWEREERVSDKLREALEVSQASVDDLLARKDQLEDALAKCNRVSYLPDYAKRAIWKVMPGLKSTYPNAPSAVRLVR